jgi:membrane fusion protein, multidrug efflux system
VVDGLRIIRAGLSPSDRVVVTNLQSAMPGAKVATRAVAIKASPAPVAASESSVPAASQATFAR